MADSNRVYTLYTVQAAGSGTAVALDYRFDGTQNRSVLCSKNTADTIAVEVSADGTTFFAYYTFPTGITSGTITVVGPFVQIRVTKTGANATCVVQLVG